MHRTTRTTVAAAAVLLTLAALAQQDVAPPGSPLPLAVRDAQRAYEGAKRKADDDYQARLKVLQRDHAQKLTAAHKSYDVAIDAALQQATRAANLDLANQLTKHKLAVADGVAEDLQNAGGNTREFLSDMEHFDVVGFEAWFGKSGVMNGTKKITVDGVYSPNGISMLPAANGSASVTFNLNRKFRAMAAHVGLCDTAAVPAIKTPITFEVLGDGRPLWRSRPVQEWKVLQECRVDVRGVNALELRVQCPGDPANAHAVWIEPRVTK